jgi:solute carrier family 25 uncoupling protein 8/9
MCNLSCAPLALYLLVEVLRWWGRVIRIIATQVKQVVLINQMESKGDGTARFIASSIASFVAEIITLPADVAKVRLQLQKKSAGDVQYRGIFFTHLSYVIASTGFVDCLKKTYRNEGPKALFKGLNPALVRQISYSRCRIVRANP